MATLPKRKEIHYHYRDTIENEYGNFIDRYTRNDENGKALSEPTNRRACRSEAIAMGGKAYFFRNGMPD